jgi:hypothetical protein
VLFSIGCEELSLLEKKKEKKKAIKRAAITNGNHKGLERFKYN